VQALVEGRAAARLGELFRERWQCATGDALEAPTDSEEAESPWPDGVRAELEDLDVAIARTRAAYDGVDEAREVERLYLDAIGAARRSLYIENQYLTSATVTRALAERLAEADGPDVVVVVPRRCEGWLEQGTVGLIRRRRLDELRRADRGGRLRVLYPHVPGVEDGVLVHSKLMVVDDALVTLGSANLSNRSMGFDSECNLAIESAGRDPRVADGLRGLRDRLLAEHLAVDQRTVADAVSGAGGSLTKAVDALAGGPARTLRPVEDEPWDGEWTAVVDAGQALADPESPEEPERLIDEFLERDVPDAARGAWLRAAFVAAALAALVALLRLTPLGESLSADRMAEWMLSLRDSPLAPVGVVATYVGASLLLIPVTLLIVATALLFPALWAVTYSLVGVLAAALVGFALGRLLGRDVVRHALGGRLNRISRRLARRGALSVAAVRLVPLAPFTLVNAVAGASHLRLRDFVVGTVAGIAPGILAIVLLEASLEEVMRRPEPRTVLAFVLVVGAVLLAFALVRRLRPGSRH